MGASIVVGARKFSGRVRVLRVILTSEFWFCAAQAISCVARVALLEKFGYSGSFARHIAAPGGELFLGGSFTF